MRDAALLPAERLSSPLPFLIAATMFFVLLASAAAIGLAGAAARIDRAERLSLQVMAANPAQREAEARAVLNALSKADAVNVVRRVPEGELRELVEPWLGQAALSDFPMPVLIEVELAAGADTASLERLAAAHALSAVINADQHWLRPVERLVALLRWLSWAIVIVAAAAAFTVIAWSARSELDKQQGTVGLLHLMGATDRQITRLFERRIAAAALAGGLIGLVAAVPVLLLVGSRIASLDSGLIPSDAAFSPRWLLLLLPPLLGTGLAMLVARATLLRALRRL